MLIRTNLRRWQYCRAISSRAYASVECVAAGWTVQIEFMETESLAQDVYINELEQNLRDAVQMMLDDGCYAQHSQQLTDWLNTVSVNASYSRMRGTHIQVNVRLLCFLYLCWLITPKFRAAPVTYSNMRAAAFH